MVVQNIIFFENKNGVGESIHSLNVRAEELILECNSDGTFSLEVWGGVKTASTHLFAWDENIDMSKTISNNGLYKVDIAGLGVINVKLISNTGSTTVIATANGGS